MKNKIACFMILSGLIMVITAVPGLCEPDEKYFNRGVLYLLMDDTGFARENFDKYFRDYPIPAIKNGFELLVERDYAEATKLFGNYLGMNHRSTHAIIGIAISTSHSQFSNAPEVFKRATTLDSGFSTAYLGLGFEAQRQKDYPRAIQYYMQAYQNDPLPEYKILPAKLYIAMNQPQRVLDLLKGEADRYRDNFYFNYYTAEAFLQLNKYEEMTPYREAANEVRPDDRSLVLLTARYYLGVNNPARASVALRALKADGADTEYKKALAHALVKQKDQNSRKYLYEVFSEQKWDLEVNYLLGLYTMWREPAMNLQNWVHRSILCGESPQKLRESFPSNLLYPEFPAQNFFDLKAMAWLTDKYLLAVAVQNSGEPEKVFVFDARSNKLIQSFPISGRFRSLVVSPRRNRLVIAVSTADDRNIQAYAADCPDQAPPKFWLLSPEKMEIPNAIAAFNASGSQVWFTDERVEKLGFDSPFAETDMLGNKKFLYHNYLYKIYRYSFDSRELTPVSRGDIAQMENSPLPALRKYAMFSTASLNHPEIQGLMETGKGYDSSSSEFVKVVFSRELDGFVVYLADLKHSFQGFVFDSRGNAILPVDESRFLGGSENFTDVDVMDLDIRRHELVLVTRKTKQLVVYNYKDYTALRPAESVESLYYDRSSKMLYILTRSQSKLFFAGAALQTLCLKPYVDKKYNVSRGLDKIERYVDETEVYFSTTYGELLRMDQQIRFTYVRPSFEGCIHDVSPSGVVAAFINSRLIFADFSNPPVPAAPAEPGKNGKAGKVQ